MAQPPDRLRSPKLYAADDSDGQQNNGKYLHELEDGNAAHKDEPSA